MQRLLLGFILFLVLVFPASAQEPIYLPIIQSGGDDCMGMASLKISDGTTSISLLASNQSGFHLEKWRPAIVQPKNGGVYRDSPIAPGRQLVYATDGTANEVFNLKINDYDQDELIVQTQELLRLLLKGRNYGPNNWQDGPVWIEARSACETNTRYALIINFTITELDNPYAAPFFNSEKLAAMDSITLGIERGHWLSNPPGSSECVQTSSQQVWSYGNKAVSSWTGAEIVYGLFETSSGKVLASTVNSIYASIDDGSSFALAKATPIAFLESFFQTSAGTILGISPFTLWRSTDDGVTWVEKAGGPNGYKLYQTPTGVLLATTRKSTDDGVTWIPYLGYSAYFKTASGKLLGWSQGSNLLYQATDLEGTAWNLLTSTPYTISEFMLQTTSGKLLVGTYTGGVLESTDDGLTWTTSISGARYSPLDQLTNGDIMLSVTSDLLWSNDDGLSWHPGLSVGALYVKEGIQLASGTIIVGGDSGVGGWIDRIVTTSISGAGSSATCDDSVYVANKQNVANLTNIYRDDGGVFSANLYPMTLPTTLLPAVPAVNDAVYFGIITTMPDTGPFTSLVFDLSVPASSTTSYTILWEYYTGAAWATLPAKDGTSSSVGALSTTGVSSIHWIPPANWATVAVNGVTAWWIRARVSALVGTLTPPVQQNSNIYTVVNSYVAIADTQVKGDIPAIAQIIAHNRSDLDGAGGSAPDLYENRLAIGLRSYNRGPTFQEFINISDEQNPFGVTVTLGTNTTFGDDYATPTGRRATYNPGGAEAMLNRATIEFGPTIARDYYGAFHAFLRVKRTAGVYSDFTIRLQVSTGSGGVTFTSETKQVQSLMAFELLDFGRITLPVSSLLMGTELGDNTIINIQASAAGGTPDLYIYDLILLPVDEWAIDATDKALETDSEVGASGGFPKVMDIDSVTNFKRNIRALVRRFGSNLITSIYQPITNGEAILQANAPQRLHFLAARALLTGAHTGANNAATLTDSTVNFLNAGVQAGMTIWNVTDGSSATITAVTATTVVGTLAGGAENDWDTGDTYRIICPHWTAPPEISHSIQVFKNERYMGLRGNR